MAAWQQLQRRAAQQRGLVTPHETRDVGMSPSTVGRRAREEGWQRLSRGVVALPGAELDGRAAVAAAALAVGGRVAVTGWTAAWLHELRARPGGTIELLVPHGRRATRAEGYQGRPVRTHRTRNLPEQDICRVDGIPCVTPARLVYDLAKEEGPSTVRALLLDVLQRRLATADQLHRCGQRLRNAKGTALVRRVARELTCERSDVVHEWHWRRRLSAHGLVPDEAQPRVQIPNGRAIHVDIGWAAYEVGLECIGLRYHNGREQRKKDHARHNGLQHTDWRVFMVTWADLDTRVAEVVDHLRKALVARGWPGKG